MNIVCYNYKKNTFFKGICGKKDFFCIFVSVFLKSMKFFLFDCSDTLREIYMQIQYSLNYVSIRQKS